ncbi:MAG: TerB family tellurite resistance protein [Gammaproteobacteria bacterium]|nr:TerB family tellurite resistance protein [Gammaproteobacteria bacterium]
MLDGIRQFFDKHIKTTGTPTGPDPVQLATAALLIEMTRMDGAIDDVERAKVMQAIETKFKLPPAEVTELLRLAEQEAQDATDYFQFTSLCNDRLSMEQKERLIGFLWEVAYANGELDKYEEHLVRKIADLLYVPHAAFIAAKLRARSANS